MKKFVVCFVLVLIGGLCGIELCMLLNLGDANPAHSNEGLRLVEDKTGGASLLLDGEEILYVSPEPEHTLFEFSSGTHKIAVIDIDQNGDSGVIDATFLMKTKKTGRAWYQVVNPDFADDLSSVQITRCGERDPDYIDVSVKE